MPTTTQPGNNLNPLPRVALLQVINTHAHHDEAIAALAEAQSLIQTWGGEVVVKEVQHRVNPDPSVYIGKGKMEWLKGVVQAQKVDVVVVNDLVNAGQLFRLEKSLWAVNTHIAVWDRVDLILNIFEKHAVSQTAKLQIELARIQHIGPRIYGLGGTVLSRQGGGIGTRGAGETNLEIERRQIKRRVQQIKKQLAHEVTIQSQRIDRRRLQGMHTIALVGYTSAGKTTLFNALTARAKETNKGLFTTLDSVVGKLKVAPHAPSVLISDTIGFIDNLPPVLIDAFRSTLLESISADELYHVIDAGDPKYHEKIDTVETILRDLGINDPPVLVFNKIDTLTTEQLAALANEFAHRQTFFVSAKQGDGIKQLKSYSYNLVV